LIYISELFMNRFNYLFLIYCTTQLLRKMNEVTDI